MPGKSKAETIRGKLQQLLFSPKGGIEGMLLSVGGSPIQVSFEAGSVDVKLLAQAMGKPVELMAEEDHSPKSRKGEHPVYKLETWAKIANKSVASNHGSITGIVAGIHYAKHGEPNGVILASGEFIHTRPHGMKKVRLEVGSSVSASGEVRSTVLGTRLLEADEVNRMKME